MNTTVISGRLVRNPGYNEVENEKGLHKIAKFVLAVRRNYSDEVSFIPVKAFAKKAEFARDYLMQGTKNWMETFIFIIPGTGFHHTTWLFLIIAQIIRAERTASFFNNFHRNYWHLTFDFLSYMLTFNSLSHLKNPPRIYICKRDFP